MWCSCRQNIRNTPDHHAVQFDNSTNKSLQITQDKSLIKTEH